MIDDVLFTQACHSLERIAHALERIADQQQAEAAPQVINVSNATPPGLERRAPVQSDHTFRGRVAGTITWDEHEEAWNDYAKRYGTEQSAERVAERGGFGYDELIDHLKREPRTWKPRV
jgi:hypothetical protein